MAQPDRPTKEVSIFQINFLYLELFLLLAAIPLCAAMHDPVGMHVNDGGLVAYRISAFQYFLIGSAVLSIVALGLFLWTLANNWKHTCWNRRRVPFIRLRSDAMILFGDTTLPWASITSVMNVRKRLIGPHRTYIVLGLADELQHNRHAIPHLDRLSRYANRAAALVRRKYGVDLADNAFLCVALDDENGLTLPNDAVVAQVEQFWNAARVGGMGAVEGGLAAPAASQGTKLHLALIIRAFGLAALTTFLLAVSVHDLLATAEKQAARENWPTVAGTVIVSQTVAQCAKQSENFPNIRYRYAVAGSGFIGTKIDGTDLDIRKRKAMQVDGGSFEVDFPTTENRCVSAEQAAALVARYPVGSSPAANYNPQAPYEAILVKTGIAVSIWVEFAALAIVALALAFLVVSYLRVALGLGTSSDSN